MTHIKKKYLYNKNVVNKFTFLLPIIILMIGIMVCYFLFSNDDQEAVIIICWVFADLVNAIKNGDLIKVFVTNSQIPISVKVFCSLWLFSFIISLFLVGRQLQAKPKFVKDAVFTKKEPYFLMRDISRCLEKIEMRRKSDELDTLIYAVKSLEEKLFVESDFGYGNEEVIKCENEIAKQLSFLFDAMQNLETGNFSNNISTVSRVVLDINFLLKYRTDLKRY